MGRTSDYAVVRVHDGRYRLDRTAPVPGPVAYAKPAMDREGSQTGWELHPIVTGQGSRSKISATAAEALTSTRPLTTAEARRLAASDSPIAPPEGVAP
ncbi:MAG: hypothetical protein ABI369_06455 [Acetobacteraceae bacterium]